VKLSEFFTVLDLLNLTREYRWLSGVHIMRESNKEKKRGLEGSFGMIQVEDGGKP
jgi:hypothetical protein